MVSTNVKKQSMVLALGWVCWYLVFLSIVGAMMLLFRRADFHNPLTLALFVGCKVVLVAFMGFSAFVQIRKQREFSLLLKEFRCSDPIDHADTMGSVALKLRSEVHGSTGRD